MRRAHAHARGGGVRPCLCAATATAHLRRRRFPLLCALPLPAQAICYTAYTIRLFAINTYGLVIHEFDPWFNFRATQYLSDNGVKAFFQWFDYMSWYPLGRPVGTTIYPGMQLTSVAIHRALAFLGRPMPVPQKRFVAALFCAASAAKLRSIAPGY